MEITYTIEENNKTILHHLINYKANFKRKTVYFG